MSDEELSCYRASRSVGADQDILWPAEAGHRAYAGMYAMIDGEETRVYHDLGIVDEVADVLVGESKHAWQHVLCLRNGVWVMVGRSTASYPKGYIENIIRDKAEDGHLFRDGEAVKL